MRTIPLLLLLSLLLGSTSLGAQTFSWGVNLYPNYSSRRLIVLGANITEKTIEEIEARETGKFSLSAGFQGGWRGEKVGFQFGVTFSETGFQTIKEPIPATDPNPEGAAERRFIYRNFLLVLPACLEFAHQLDSKNDFFFLLGVAAGVNLANQVQEVYYFGDTKTRTPGELPAESFRPLNVAFQTGMGWEHDLSERLSLFLQPTFQFWLGSLLQDADLDRSLYDMGLKMGLKFRR